jgi:ABC-type nitrate/sulfonate/bicarbonate transport system permease component
VSAAARHRLGAVGLPLLGAAVIGLLWVVGGRAGWANGMVVTPDDAVRPVVDSHDVYWRATKATGWAAFRGLVIGGGLAFTAAFLAGTIPALRRSLTRLAAIANAAPWIAVAPCLLIILGRGRGPAGVAALAVFFVVFVSTTVGLGAAPAAVHDVATALGTGRLRRVWSVQLPACWPSVVDGLKLAAPAAMAGAVFGEWYGAPRGLGVLLITAMQSARPERLWAASLLSAACGLGAFALLAGCRQLLGRRFGSAIAQAAPAGSTHRARGARVLAIEAGTVVALSAVLVFAWWAWIEIRDISPLVVPPPSAAWDDLSASPGTYLSATGATLVTAGVALALGVTVGLVAAVAASRVRVLAGMIVPVIVVLAATPLVALFPLFARVLGYQPNTVRVLAALMVFFPVFVYARSGLAAASPSSLDVVDALGARAGQRFRLVVLPAAVPHIASGIRIAAGSAVIAAVVGESLIGRDGLGVDFTYAYSQLELPRAFGAAIVIVVVSVAVFAVAGWAERAVHARWT